MIFTASIGFPQSGWLYLLILLILRDSEGTMVDRAWILSSETCSSYLKEEMNTYKRWLTVESINHAMSGVQTDSTEQSGGKCENLKSKMYVL